MCHKSSQLSITSLSTIIFIALKQLSSEKFLYFFTRHIYIDSVVCYLCFNTENVAEGRNEYLTTSTLLR